jgi:hypothetical protein
MDREPANTRGRECIIPDVSRTFHFGRRGLNVNNDYFYNNVRGYGSTM